MTEQTKLDEERPSGSGTSTAHCPAGLGTLFDPFGTHAVDPFPFYAQARAQEPVFYSSVLDMWVVARYDDIVAVLRDPHTYSSSDSLPTLRGAGGSDDIADFGAGAMVRSDPPEHTRQRMAYAEAFTPARVNALEPMVREVADDLIDQLGAGPADLITQFAYPLPLTVILRVFGVPVEDLAKCRVWTEDIKRLYYAPGLSAEERTAAAAGMEAFQAYAVDLVTSRAREPREDLISHLLHATLGDFAPFSIQEAVGNVTGLVHAGHETTASLIGSLMWRLIGHPDQMAYLRENPERLPAAVEEGLRKDSPTLGMCRTTTRDAELSGVAIPAGARLLLLYASGNHDERRFADPDRFDVSRPRDTQHLSFGRGIHFCIGAPLARLEARIAVERLLTRLPGLRAADPDAVPQRQPLFPLWALSSLPVMWDSGP